MMTPSPAPSPKRGPKGWLQRHGATRLLAATALVLVELAGAMLLMAWLIGEIWSDRAQWSQWLHWIPTLAILAGLLAGLIAAALRMVVLRRRGWRRWTPIGAWLLAIAWVGVVFTTVEHRLLHGAPEPPARAFTIAHWTAQPSETDAWADALDRLAGYEADLTIIGDSMMSSRSALLDPLVEKNPWTWRIGPFVVATDLPVIRHQYIVAKDDVWVVRLELDTTEALGGPIIVDLVDLPSDLNRPRREIADLARRLIDEAEVEPPDLVIGDCNMTRGSASLERAFPGMRHGFSTGGHGYAATFRRTWPLPLYHIDHVLTAENLDCARYDTVDFGIGRHLGQRAWIVPAAAKGNSVRARPSGE